MLEIKDVYTVYYNSQFISFLKDIAAQTQGVTLNSYNTVDLDDGPNTRVRFAMSFDTNVLAQTVMEKIRDAAALYKTPFA